MKKLNLAFFITLAILCTSYLEAKATWYNGSWLNREKITIKASQVNGDLSEFPIYLNLKDLPASFFSQVKNSGADIRITTASGNTETAFELVAIDTVNGTGELWFKAPSLSGSSDTDFFIYYDNNGASAYLESDTYGTHNVWSNGYVSVYHMNDDPTGTIFDSSSFSNDGNTSGTMTNSDLVSGRLGQAIDFDGADDFINTTDTNYFNGRTALSLSAWIRPDSMSDYDGVICSRTPVTHEETIFFGISGPGNNDDIDMWLERDNITAAPALISSSNQNIITTNEYHFIASSYNGSVASIYHNDLRINSIPMSLHMSELGQDDDFKIGQDNLGGRLFDGLIDEVRISNKARSPEWFNSVYNNQNSTGNFYLISNGQGAGFIPSLWSNYHKITIPAYILDENLENFPVYVDLADLPTSFFSTVLSNGEDLRVTKADQDTQQAFELVDLDTANGTGELWFKAELLSSTQDNEFYIWYGNSQALPYDRDDEFGSENVWSEGFAGVWHMNEDPTNPVLDSTSNTNDATSFGSMNGSDLISGQLGKSIEFDGINDYLDTASSASLNLGNTDNAHFSAWFKTSDTNYETIFEYGPSGQGYYFGLHNLGGNNIVYGAPAVDCDTPAISAADWHHMSGIWDNSTDTVSTYLDGKFSTSQTTATNTTGLTQQMLRIGARNSSNLQFTGPLDEIRISSVPRTANWIRAEYLNQSSTDKFYYIDNSDQINNLSWSQRFKITIPASEVNGDLNDFPTYLNLADLPNDFFTTVNGTGADIRVTENDQETQTSFELVSIDTANGTGELWFKAPYLSSSFDNIFYIHAGNAAAQAYSEDHLFGTQNVWSNGFVAVYHMNEDPGGSILDSTKFSNDGTSFGAMSSSSLVQGQLGKGLNFDGSLNQYIDIGSDSSIKGFNGSLSLSAWSQGESIDPGNHGLIGTMGYSPQRGIGIAKGIGNPNNITFWIPINGTTINSTSISNANNPEEMNFAYGTFDGPNTKQVLYKDGIPMSTDSTAPSAFHNTNINSFKIGNRGDGNGEFDGLIDDVKIANKARSRNWVITEYLNQKAPGNFYLIENGNTGFSTSLWSNYHKITIPAYIIDENLEDFPVYIDLADLPASFFSTVQNNGEDLRVTKADQDTQLAFELVDLDTTNGSGELWFKADLLSSTQDNEFYIWYGNSSAYAYDRHDEFGSENVWTKGYLGVWHMNENLNGAQLIDSSANRNHGNESGAMNGDNLVSGAVGKAIELDGIDDLITIPDSDSLEQGNTLITVQAWFNNLVKPTGPGSRFAVLNKYASALGQRQFALGLDTVNLSWNIQDNPAVFDGTTNLYESSTINNGDWYHVSADFESSTEMNIFIDGQLSSTMNTGVPVDMSNTAQDLLIGSLDASSFNNSIVDEMRVINQLRSPAWIRAEYLNQKSTDNFYYIDSENQINNNSWSQSFKITIPASEINGDLNDFPTYLNLADLPNSFFSTVNGSGFDIRVTEDDLQTQTSFELVSIDTVNGAGELWFKAPYLSSTVDNTFYIHAGNASAQAYSKEHLFGSQNLWSNGFVAVYHMNEDPSSVIIDSTKYDNSGQSVGSMSSNDLVRSNIGKAINFDGVDDHILVQDDNSLDFGTEDFSLSLWVNHQNGTNANQGLITKRNNTNQQFFLQTATTKGFNSYLRSDASPTSFGAGSNFPVNDWEYVSYNADRDANGSIIMGDNSPVFNDITADSATVSTTTNLEIGTADAFLTASSVKEFQGSLDEIRISKRLRSKDWNNTEYYNQNSPGAFYLIENGNVAGWNISNWSFYNKITIPASTLNGDLENFPVYVDLSTLPNSFFDRVQSDGRDIRITQDDYDTQQAFELVNIDTHNGAGELWFKADALSSTVDNVFYIFYGNPNAHAYDRNDEFGSENTWGDDYLGVFHMNESPTGLILDSTYYRNHGNSNGAMSSSDLVSGQVGKAINFDGSDDYIDFGQVGWSSIAANFSISTWLRSDDISATHKYAVSKDNGGPFNGSNGHIFIGQSNPGNVLSFRMGGGGAELNGGTGIYQGSILASNWYHVVGDWNGGTASLFQDGDLVASESQAISGSIADNFYAGQTSAGFRWDGLIDEIQVLNTNKSSDWHKAANKNQSHTGKLYTIDDGVLNKNLWSNIFRVTIQASQVNGDLNDFPVYVNLADLPNDFFTTVNGSGADLRVLESDQKTQTAFEIVSLDTANGSGELWFKAPFLSGTTDTDFFILTGNPNAEAYPEDHIFGAQNVWSNGYVAVYHMNQDPSTGTIYDSTSFNHDGTPNGAMNGADLVGGQLGSAIDFDGIDDFIEITDTGALSFGDAATTNPYHIQAWVYCRAEGGNSPSAPIISKYQSYSPMNGEWSFAITSAFNLSHQNIDNATGVRVRQNADNPIPRNHWVSLNGNYNGGTSDSSIAMSFNGDTIASTGHGQDGSYVAIHDFSSTVTIGANLYIGNLTFSGFMDGVIDEARISSKDRSTAWIKTEYNNQNSPNAFYTTTKVQSGNAIMHGRMF